MTDDPNDPLRQHPAPTAALKAALGTLASPERFSPLDDRKPPGLDRSVKTEFLRRTIARAFTSRATRRVQGLRQMEHLLARQEAGFPIGVQGHLPGSIAREFPISNSVMRRELRGLRVAGLVEIAEQIELGFWVAPYRAQVPRRQGGAASSGAAS